MLPTTSKSPAKRIVEFFLVAAAIGSSIYLIAWHDFIPSPLAIMLGLVPTILLTLAFAAPLAQSLYRDSCVASASFYFVLKEVALAIIALALIFFLSWTFFGWSVPRLITKAIGTPDAFVVEVTKQNRKSRRGCELTLQYASKPTPFLLRLCLSEEQFAELPDGPFSVRQHGHSSPLGTLIQGYSLRR